ncbi:MAG: hypothetical protein ACT4ON_04865, partial [Bacteroidota bacterium]
MRSLFLVYISIILVGITSCKKDTPNNVPNTAVDIYLYINNPSNVNLTAIGGWVYINGGVRGILVYRKSSSEFMAYDRNCTYRSGDPYPCATISVDASNIIATDTCCNSKFSIYDGSVTQGPAGLPLK